MSEQKITENCISAFREYLVLEEKSRATVEQYLRVVWAFSVCAGGQTVTKELVMAHKHSLLEKGYAVRSINSMLASINSFWIFRAGETARSRA